MILLMFLHIIFILCLSITSLLATTKSILDFNKTPINGKGYIWSPLFKATWDKLQDNFEREIDRVEPPNKIIQNLSHFKIDLKSVMPEGVWETYSGPASEDFLIKVADKIKDKWGIDLPQDRFTIDPNGHIAIGVINASLDFKKKFYSSNKNTLEFTQNDGIKKDVVFFGSSGEHSKNFSSEVKIHHYEKEEFIVSIKTVREKENVILFLPKNALSIAEAIKRVNKSIHPSELEKTNTASIANNYFMRGDTLKVPYISLSDSTDFSDLLTGKIYYKGLDLPQEVLSSFQITNFSLSEKGAKVRVIASTDIFGGTMKPKNCVFDKPFYVFLWKEKSRYPYFSLWVDDVSILKKEE